MGGSAGPQLPSTLPTFDFVRHAATPLGAVAVVMTLTLVLAWVVDDCDQRFWIIVLFSAEVVFAFVVIAWFAFHNPTLVLPSVPVDPKPDEDADQLETELESKVPGLIKSLDDPEKFNKWIQDLLESSGDDDTSHDEPTG